MASIAQLVEHVLRKRTVVGSIPTGGSLMLPQKNLCCLVTQLLYTIACGDSYVSQSQFEPDPGLIELNLD